MKRSLKFILDCEISIKLLVTFINWKILTVKKGAKSVTVRITNNVKTSNKSIRLASTSTALLEI